MENSLKVLRNKIKEKTILVIRIEKGHPYNLDAIKTSDVLALLDEQEKELREMLKFATMYKTESDYPRDAKLIKKILGEEAGDKTPRKEEQESPLK